MKLGGLWPALLWRHDSPSRSHSRSPSLSFLSAVYLHFPCARREVMQYALASLSKEITKGCVALAPAFTHPPSGVYGSSEAAKTCKKAKWEMERCVAGSSRNPAVRRRRHVSFSLRSIRLPATYTCRVVVVNFLTTAGSWWRSPFYNRLKLRRRSLYHLPPPRLTLEQLDRWVRR